MLRPHQVVGPDGEPWTVGRRVLPWHPRRRLFRHRLELPDGPSFGDFTGDDPVSVVLGVLTLLLLVIVGVLVLGPFVGLLALGLEWLTVLVVAALGTGLRLALGWPFAVVATSGTRRYEVNVRGWRLSGRIAEQLAERIKATGQPPGSAPQ